ncbi:MAG TPA: response regulator transcription factor [Niabella sp.]|nr:response regulator transcription factor [Niabella sp.]
MSILTLTNYELPSECSTILFKTLGDCIAIEHWATINQETFHEDAILIIFKDCGDLPESVYKNPAIINSKTIFISENFSLETIYELAAHNLLGFIDYNDLTSATLQAAIAACNMGCLFISKTILAECKSVSPSEERVVRVSKREIEIIKLIGEELTTKEIASRLYLSKRTVDTHRQNLMRKLDVRNNVGLVKAAIQRHLIDL